MYGVIEYDISPIRGPLANAFVILINALFFNVKLIGLQDVYPLDYSQQLLNEDENVFDFIIVGAGAAGCAAANRITEQEQWSVLLIEAGDYPPPTSEVPGLYYTFLRSKEDWQFRLEKDKKACQSFVGQTCTLTKGKVLGGTSSITNMRYIRGSPEDYDKNNFPMWSSEVAYKIFEKIENFQGNEDVVQYTYGSSGEIYLNYFNYTSAAKQMLLDAYRSTGYIKMPKRQFVGFTDHLLYIKNGERFNMAKSFLTPVKERPNLFFTRKTEVEGIVVSEPVDKRAIGVNVSIDGNRFFIRAKKEVILTAGAINNPKLLLVSGIGPRNYLAEKKIPFVVHLPGVGKNLQLHLTVPLFFGLDPCSDGCEKDYYQEIDLIRDVFDYVMFKTGNLSNININVFANYLLTTKTGTTLPNLSVHHSYFKIGDRRLMAMVEGMNYIPKLIHSLVHINQERAILVFYVTVVNPLSKGELLLNDTHFLSNPSIRPNLLSDDEGWDFDTLISGFNYVTNLTETDHFKKYNAEFLDLDIPNCRNYKFCTKQYVKCYIHNLAHPKSDVVGTTKMGEDCEEDTVVKQTLEVKRVRCLRVADSSVLGHIPIGNTVATDAMIGYNLGEIMKEKWVKDYESPYLHYNASVRKED